jgi:3-hydroxybutyryl-CoA dehydratase
LVVPRPPQTIVVTDETAGRALMVADIAVGDAVEQRFAFERSMRDAFAIVANDRAPIHDDERFAHNKGFGAPIIQGLCVATRFSRLIGMYLPGQHAILERMNIAFRQPTYEGQSLRFRVRVTRVLRPMRVIKLGLLATSDSGNHLVGEAQCLIR